MATDPGTVEFLLDQLGTRGASYTTKRMFGEYCLYREGAPVAFVCDDVLFVKDTPAGRESMSAANLLAFGPPYPGAKDYLRLPPDGWDDGQWLRNLLDATAAALPAPRLKKTLSAKDSPTRKSAPAKKAASKAVKKTTTAAKKRAAVTKTTKTSGRAIKSSPGAKASKSASKATRSRGRGDGGR